MDPNLPNLLTLLRIVLIPVFVLVFYLPVGWSNDVSMVIFLLAAVTDWLDGFLARRWSLSSPFGAFLDPVADKLMIAVVLILLVQDDPRVLIVIPAAVIIGREIAVSALREWMAELGERTTVAVSIVGKFKTGAQMVALLMMLYAESTAGVIYYLGVGLLYVSAILTLWSMVAYLRAAWPALREGRVGGGLGEPPGPGQG